MKKIIYISFIIVLFNCKKKENKIYRKFTEKDAYEIVNHLILKIKEEEKTYGFDTIIYWNRRQLINPPYAHTFIGSDTLVTYYELPDDFPRFTKGNWKIDKIKNIKPVDDKYYKLYFNESNNKRELDELWRAEYNSNVFHNVSYPIYNPETKIAIIKDIIFEPLTMCGTGKKKIYVYKKGKWTFR